VTSLDGAVLLAGFELEKPSVDRAGVGPVGRQLMDAKESVATGE
jgi:hypothetical protein